MAQHDFNIANATFPSVRSDINSVLEAINTSNSGTSRPSSAVAGTIWLDTTSATTPTLKFYDGADDISLATLDYTANTVNWLDSTVVFDIVGDTTPQLGGDLDVNGNDIVSVSNGNITFTPDGTGKVVISGLSFPTSDGTADQVLKTDGSGNLSFTSVEGRTGTVNWDTTPKTSTVTAANGVGYFVNTTDGEITVNLPAGSAGDIVSLSDYAATWQTNNVTVTPNGTDKIGSVNDNAVLSTEGQSVTFVFVDSTQGWINTMDSTSNVRGLSTYDVQYLVVAGGGGGGASTAGGGGAGGYRTLSSKTFPVASGDSFPITIGAGGGGGTPSVCLGTPGSNSVFSTITSAGGGGASSSNSPSGGLDGGSGGGGGAAKPGGTGNTPPVSPPQGNPGGSTAPPGSGGGGGGAGAASSVSCGGIGSSFTDLGPLAPSYGTTGPAPGRYFSGGGGGYAGGSGGSGGGSPYPGNGTTNTGGGGSATNAGGSGIVIIRYVTTDGSPAVSGGNATTTCGSDTIRVFTGPGTFTA